MEIEINSKHCNSLVINENKLIKCKSVIDKNKIFCEKHLYINRYYIEIKDCCICYENIDKTNEIPLECGHIFHKNCLIKIINKECPLCKKEFSYTEKIFFKDEHVININENVHIGTTNRCSRYPKNLFIVSIFMWIFVIILVVSIK